MCNPVSFFASWHGDSRTVYISEKTDSHTEMAREFGIKDDGNGRLCAGEFHPDPAKPSPDTASWVIVWDHAGCDRKPDWLDDDALSGLRAELERRCAAYVFTTDGNTTSCRAFVFGSGRVVARGSSRVEAHGSSSVVAWGSSRVVAQGSSSVVARGSSRVVARGSSSVVAQGSSRVEAQGSSSVVARGSSRVVAWGFSRVVAHGSSRVEAHGSSRVVAMSKYCVVVFRDNHDGMGYPAMIWNHNGSGTTTLAELKMQASKGDEG